MHELTLAFHILDIVTEEVKRAGGGTVESIQVEAGVLAGVDNEALLQAYKMVVEDTALAVADLIIKPASGKGHCRDCDMEFMMESIFSCCPECHQPALKITEGQDLRIQSITLK